MEIPSLPGQAIRALGLTHEPLGYGVPGALFLAIMGAYRVELLLELLQTPLLGYKTKIGILIFLSFAIGFGLVLIGDIVVGWLSKGLRLIQKLSDKSTTIPADLEYRLVEHAFREKQADLAEEIANAKGRQAVENYHSMILILLVYYTNFSHELGESWRRYIRNSNVLAGSSAALLLSGVFVAWSSQSTGPSLIVALGIVGLLFGVADRRVGLRHAARLIAAGYLHERKVA